jgi:biopolymer transport protein ExbD
MRIRNTRRAEKVTLQMTPMIDVVFQLLIFFTLTFKISGQEGDFNIKMPLGAPRESTPVLDTLPPMKLRLTADGNGDLAGMQLNDRGMTSFDQLRTAIIGLIGGDAPVATRETAEIELDCDYDLRYENVIDAITAVTGQPTEGGQIIKLIEKIRFAPPRKSGS